MFGQVVVSFADSKDLYAGIERMVKVLLFAIISLSFDILLDVLTIGYVKYGNVCSLCKF